MNKLRFNRSLCYGAIVASLLVSGCTLGPDFKAPGHSELLTYMGTKAPLEQQQVSAAERGWKEIYQDLHLQNLIEKALKNNLDLRIAQSKVQAALANQTISDSALWPSLNLQPTFEREEGLDSSPANSYEFKGYFAWELDLFGANRRASEAALADLMATQQAAYAMQLSLIAQVASQFYQLKEIEQQLEITENTLEIRQNELRLARIRKEGGVISGLEQKQAEVEVESTKATIAPLLLAEHKAKTQLRLLVGDADTDVSGGNDIFAQVLIKNLEPNMPAELLKRRPDVQQALKAWESATAQIGVAKADLFPKLSLTGELGTESSDIGDLLSGGNVVWMLGLDVFQPLFNAGKNRANLSAKEEQAYQAGLNYQKVVLQALKEVSDEMRAFQSSSDNFEAQRSLVMSTREYFRLAQLRYRNGVSSSLDLMDAQRQLFSAEKALASAQLQRLESMTRLYRALAGGWFATTPVNEKELQPKTKEVLSS